MSRWRADPDKDVPRQKVHEKKNIFNSRVTFATVNKMYLRERCCKDGCFNQIVLASRNGFCVMDLLIVSTFFDVTSLHVMVAGSWTFGRGTSLSGSALHLEINLY